MILEQIPTGLLLLSLLLLLCVSAFFSGSETAFMSVNRYRLAHLAGKGDRRAQRVMRLLKKPDRLIGLILFGNNLANIIIAQLATLLGYRLYGDAGIAAATGILTLLMLILAELAPKTLGVTHPQAIAMPASLLYLLLMKLLYPLVWLINLFANALLEALGISQATETVNPLTREELRTALITSGRKITPEYRNMLFGILDLEKKTAEDIMIPRNEIFGIDIDAEADEISGQLLNTNYTHIPLYRGEINKIVGVMHARNLLPLVGQNGVTKENLEKVAVPPAYMPENSTLLQALMEFKNHKKRLSLVVDEYGDIQGLITLEDLLEEIVGEFTSDPSTYDLEMDRREDGSVIVDGSCHIRELNRAMNWNFRENGPKTINGLILEHLELVPEKGTCMLIGNHPIEVIKTHQNAVKTVKISPVYIRPGDD